MLEYPLREFINVYAYRGCFMFQWEITSVMHACRDILTGAYPFLEPYIKISCEKTKGALDAGQPGDDIRAVYGADAFAHHCTFQGWEEVEGQCPFAWARETNRSFMPAHHKIEQVKT
jgi:hypothetical protein